MLPPWLTAGALQWLQRRAPQAAEHPAEMPALPPVSHLHLEPNPEPTCSPPTPRSRDPDFPISCGGTTTNELLMGYIFYRRA